MKKIVPLAGLIGGTAAWYILSNKQLRKELGEAKTSQETVAILKNRLGADGEKIANAVHEWFHSEEVQGGISKAKDVAEETFSTAKDLAGEGLTKAKAGFGTFLAKAKSAKDAFAKDFQKEDAKESAGGIGGFFAKAKKAKDAAMKSIKRD